MENAHTSLKAKKVRHPGKNAQFYRDFLFQVLFQKFVVSRVCSSLGSHGVLVAIKRKGWGQKTRKLETRIEIISYFQKRLGGKMLAISPVKPFYPFERVKVDQWVGQCAAPVEKIEPVAKPTGNNRTRFIKLAHHIFETVIHPGPEICQFTLVEPVVDSYTKHDTKPRKQGCYCSRWNCARSNKKEEMMLASALNK